MEGLQNLGNNIDATMYIRGFDVVICHNEIWKIGDTDADVLSK